jgi:Asp-tRNA(Asn)/Glu-tRNA(Gln) amidotransferase A subunit family amidase
VTLLHGVDGRPAGPRDHAIFTGWVNIFGGLAISLQIGVSASGLPIGAQLAADFGADASHACLRARSVARCRAARATDDGGLTP